VRNVAGRGRLDESLDDSGGGRRLEPEALVGVVETSLAEALRLAAEAKHWEIVAQLAEELATRRRARDGGREVLAATLAGRSRAR
jgi:hypothetical protein